MKRRRSLVFRCQVLGCLLAEFVETLLGVLCIVKNEVPAVQMGVREGLHGILGLLLSEELNEAIASGGAIELAWDAHTLHLSVGTEELSELLACCLECQVLHQQFVALCLLGYSS